MIKSYFFIIKIKQLSLFSCDGAYLETHHLLSRNSLITISKLTKSISKLTFSISKLTEYISKLTTYYLETHHHSL